MRTTLMLGAILFAGAARAGAPSLTVPMNFVDENGIGGVAGDVVITDSPYGLMFTPTLAGLPAGVHGFHVHENGSCGPAMNNGKAVAALAAGGHWDPDKTLHHAGPYGDGHLGDLPALYVNTDGNATDPVLAPRLHSIDSLRGRALMVHVGGDNHRDHPMPLGGGGGRVLCGIAK